MERVEELSNELVDQPAKLHPLKCDITKEDDILEAFEWIKSNVGSVSIMINNAGLTRPTTLIGSYTRIIINFLRNFGQLESYYL